MEQKNLPAIKELFGSGLALYKEKFSLLIQIAAFPALLIFLAGVFGNLQMKFAAFVFSILGVTASILASIAFIHAVKDEVALGEAYRLAKSKFFSYAWVSALVGIIVMGGFVMAVVPAVIFSVWFSLSSYILVIEGRKGLDALLKSKEYVRGYWWPVLFRVLAVGIPMGIISVGVSYIAALFGKNAVEFGAALIQIFLSPLVAAYYYSFYRALSSLKPEVATSAPSGNRKFFIFSGVLGILFITLLPVIILLWVVASSTK